MKHPFLVPRVKTRRALTLLNELELEISAYLATGPAKISTALSKVESRHQAIRFSIKLDPVPTTISAILGDVIHNLRSALDLTACELVRVAGQSDENVYFPFCETPDDLDRMIKGKHFDRAGDKAVALLRQLKPYRNGHTALRAIHDLDIHDKHRTIIPSLMRVASPIIRRWDDDGTPNLTVVGDPDAPSNLKIVFPDGSALSGQELVPTLHELVKLVDGIVDAFCAVANQ